jgi:hypothetical protein
MRILQLFLILCSIFLILIVQVFLIYQAWIYFIQKQEVLTFVSLLSFYFFMLLLMQLFVLLRKIQMNEGHTSESQTNVKKF